MTIPNEIIGIFIGFILTEIGVFIGFIWKASQMYRNDREANLIFLNKLKSEFDKHFNSLEMSIQHEASAREKCEIESKKEADKKLQEFRHQVELDKLMSKRDIEELKEQFSDLIDKVEKTQESVSVIHRRIDELFKMIKTKNESAAPAPKKTSKRVS